MVYYNCDMECKKWSSLKKHENELLLLACSSCFKDNFHTFEVSISHSIAEIELFKNVKALNIEKPSVAILYFPHLHNF